MSPLFQTRRLTPESINDLPKAREPSWYLQKIQARTLDGHTRALFPASLEIAKGFPKGPTKGSSYNCIVDRMLSWGFISGIPLATLRLRDICPLFTLSLLGAPPCLLSSADSAAFQDPELCSFRVSAYDSPEGLVLGFQPQMLLPACPKTMLGFRS